MKYIHFFLFYTLTIQNFSFANDDIESVLTWKNSGSIRKLSEEEISSWNNNEHQKIAKFLKKTFQS